MSNDDTFAAETLRRAAAAMRDHAESATPGPWTETGKSARYGGIVAPADYRTEPGETDGYGGRLIGESMRKADRDYVASWPPAVALAVADWLEDFAERHNWGDHDDYWDCSASLPPLAVARAYLGDTT